jgi:hypothetical protein
VTLSPNSPGSSSDLDWHDYDSEDSVERTEYNASSVNDAETLGPLTEIRAYLASFEAIIALHQAPTTEDAEYVTE